MKRLNNKASSTLDMFSAWIVLCLLLPAAKGFMIHNTRRSLCLEDTEPTGEVLLKTCKLDSESQQWRWLDQSMLMNYATSRCLSAEQKEPIQTRSCDVDPAGLIWDCDRDRLISKNTSMMLSIEGRRLTLSQDSKHSKWKSIDEGDICQEKLRSRRASEDPDVFEVGEMGKIGDMTKEEIEYLRWYYRTEDPTIWKFVLLGLAFICLLIGFLLLGMGAMASKNRKKIAKYKAAAALAQKSEELRVISYPREDIPSTPSPERSPQGTKDSLSNGKANELKAGDIIVTWKDGNTSCLYPDAAAVEELLEKEKKEVEIVEEKEEEISTVELEVHQVDEPIE